jgi:L-lactate utilization protein LutB
MQIEAASRALEANNFGGRVAKSRAAATETILSLIPRDATVGVGDSATVRQIGILEKLEERGTKLLNPFSRESTTDPSKRDVRHELSRAVFTTDVLITGTNAVTLDGKLVNVDAVGNRVAAMVFGPKQVIIVVGRNKIVRDVDAALHRIKNVIAPYHARTKEFATPCARTGRCSDCRSLDRLCNVTTILEKRPWRTGMTIILVDEDLGLSWDETWPPRRIRRIKSNYEGVTWVFARSLH